MKIIDRVKPIALYVWRSNYLKYVIVVLFCVLLIGFLDENSVWHHIRNQQRIGELKDEIELYNKRHKRTVFYESRRRGYLRDQRR